jgi:hypothetical protein
MGIKWERNIHTIQPQRRIILSHSIYAQPSKRLTVAARIHEMTSKLINAFEVKNLSFSQISFSNLGEYLFEA